MSTTRRCRTCDKNKLTFAMPPRPGTDLRCQPCITRQAERNARYQAEAERQDACRAEDARATLVTDLVNRDIVSKALVGIREKWRVNGCQPDCRACGLGIPAGQSSRTYLSGGGRGDVVSHTTGARRTEGRGFGGQREDRG